MTTGVFSSTPAACKLPGVCKLPQGTVNWSVVKPLAAVVVSLVAVKGWPLANHWKADGAPSAVPVKTTLAPELMVYGPPALNNCSFTATVIGRSLVVAGK